MKTIINSQRLLDSFRELVAIDSPSFGERAMADELTARLKKLGFAMPDSMANFLFARHPDIGGQQLYQTLKDRGILVRHFETPRLKDYNRITIGSPEQMETLIATLKSILEELP